MKPLIRADIPAARAAIAKVLPALRSVTLPIFRATTLAALCKNVFKALTIIASICASLISYSFCLRVIGD